MTLPVIDILEGARARGEFLFVFDGSREGWTEDIEIYAPGYLEMEAAGLEADHDHSRLIDLTTAFDVRQRMFEAEIGRGGASLISEWFEGAAFRQQACDRSIVNPQSLETI
jgi:hypothetical protein